MKPWTKNQLGRLRLYLMVNSDKRNKYLKKHNVFAAMGDNVFFQPRVIPADPKLIKFHNNIVVTSNVTFVTHDVFDLGINYMYPDRKVPNLMKPIEIMDNVFIGCNSTILGGITIGPNVVIAAGSVVTKDVPPNSVVAGNPAKVVKTFDEYINKRYQSYHSLDIDDIWNHFYENKN